jgi:hypothetical protein
MKDGLCQWFERVHGPTFMVQLLNNLVLKALGLSLGVNRMWTKKNDHAPQKVKVLIFLIRAQKGQFDHSLIFSWASLVLPSC